MKSTVTIRFTSGRHEKYEVELWGGNSSAVRLKTLIESPALTLQVGSELVIFPMSAIEAISVTIAKDDVEKVNLGDVRVAKRLK
jgi:hypothetical protein